MATFALPKDNDKDKHKHKDQDHQIPDKTSNTIKVAWYDSSTVASWDVITDFNTVGKGGQRMSTMDNLLQVTFFVAIVIIF